MVQQRITTATLSNGLVVCVEELPEAESAAYALLVPAGCLWEPAELGGTAAILTELLSRGAGELDSRALSCRLDELGVQAHESISVAHLALGGVCLAERLPEALRLMAEMVQRPHLPEEDYEAAVASIHQNLLGLMDEPRDQVMQELRKLAYGELWGRCPEGTFAGLERASYAQVRRHYQQTFLPAGSILGIAGRVQSEEVIRLLEKELNGWTGSAPSFPDVARTEGTYQHAVQDSAQTHIGVAYQAVPYTDPDYYAAWAAVNVLSGGMSSRLFTEIREKRGLCYSVYASLHSHRPAGRVLCYVGSSADRAQESLDVLLSELIRMADGVSEAELARCRARAKSALIMSQESTSARASSLARDWHHLGRVTTLDEVRARIEALTPANIQDYVRRYPARDFSIYTIGPRPLEVRP